MIDICFDAGRLYLVVLTFSREISDTNLPVCIFIAHSFFPIFLCVCMCASLKDSYHIYIQLPYDAFFIQLIRHRIYLITVDNWCATFCYQLWISGISPFFFTIRWWQNGIHILCSSRRGWRRRGKEMSIMQELPIALHYITQHVMRWFYGHENNYCYSYLIACGLNRKFFFCCLLAFIFFY